MFDELYERYKSSVYSLACYLTRNQREAEDLFQETWLRVVQHLPHKSVDVKNCKTWIMTIETNLYRDWLRKKKVRRLFSTQKSEAVEREDNVLQRSFWGSEDDGAKDSNRLDVRMAVSKAIDRLPKKQRIVFMLKEIEGFKYSEIGEVLRMPAGTVKSLMHRAVKGLRRELWDYAPNKSIIVSV